MRLWDLIGEALDRPGARTLLLAIGKPPMLRAGEELEPLRPDLPPLTWKTMALLLSTAIDPDRWDAIEAAGEAELTLASGTGRPIRLTLFRASGGWSAVVHL